MIYKIGQGIDAHKFSNTGILKLGLIKFSKHKKLNADSDGDVVVHAIVDALLSSAQKGDIGSIFGLKNNKSGKYFLQKTLKVISPLKPQNIIVNIITSALIIGDKKKEMSNALSKILNCQVSITATTTDGFLTHEKNGVLVIANCLIG